MRQVVRNRSHSGGGVLPLVAIGMIAIMTAGAFMVKTIWWQTEHLMYEKIAGAAAIGAMEAYRAETDSALKDQAALNSAQSLVDENVGVMRVGMGGGNTPLSVGVTEVSGYWDFPLAPSCTGSCFTPGGVTGKTNNAVEVTIDASLDSGLLFGGFLPNSKPDVSLRAVAAYRDGIGVVIVE